MLWEEEGFPKMTPDQDTRKLRQKVSFEEKWYHLKKIVKEMNMNAQGFVNGKINLNCVRRI